MLARSKPVSYTHLDVYKRQPITFAEDETFDVGLDTRTGVAMIEYRYDSPFNFTGTIDKLTFKLEPEQHAAVPGTAKNAQKR